MKHDIKIDEMAGSPLNRIIVKYYDALQYNNALQIDVVDIQSQILHHRSRGIISTDARVKHGIVLFNIIEGIFEVNNYRAIAKI
jgi:hypothetical protein